MLGDEMIDEASRKMALVIAAKGRAAGPARDHRSSSRPTGTEPTVRPHATDGATRMARLAQTAGLTDVQQEILSTVRTFVDKEIMPHATELEHKDEFPDAIVEGMKEMGLFGLTIPEEYGGLGESLLTYALVVEEIARGWMCVSGVINTHFIVAYLIMQHGTDEQKQRLLPKMATGEMRGAFSMSEPDCGSDVAGDQAPRRRARRRRATSSTARRCG